MVNLKNHLSFFNRLLNINPDEWSRVLLVWLMRFLYRLAFVIAWTIITAMFVYRFGIETLPYLFLVNAFFIMLGSFIYVYLLRKLKRSNLILLTIFLAGILLLFASLISQVENNYLLFTFLLLSESLFLVQLNILFEGFIEKLFTSLESERTFPIIESADVFGGIAAGLLIIFFSGSVNSLKFINIATISLFLIVPVVLKVRSFQLDFNLLPDLRDSTTKTLKDRLHKAAEYINRMDFLKALTAIVFFHWIFVNLLEFHYTTAVYEYVKASVPDTGSGFEHALVHDLGSLNILFFASALVVQLFLGSRLISRLGIIGSMLIYPTIMILSVLGLLLNFNFFTAVLAKNNFVISGTVYKNAYLSSYYAIKEKMRPYIREFLEGFVHPVGALFGTGILLLMQHFVPNDLPIYLGILMFIVLLYMLHLLFVMQRGYTSMAIYDLLHASKDSERINAAEILVQEGHSSGELSVLISQFYDKKTSLSLKLKILKIMKAKVDKRMIPDVLNILESSRGKLRYAALEVLDEFKSFGYKASRHAFSNHRILEVLKSIFKKEKDVKYKIMLLNILFRFKHFDAIGFLVKVFCSSEKPELLAASLVVARSFDDVGMLHYVEPLLKHKNPDVRAQAILTVFSFEAYKHNVAKEIAAKMLYSKSPANRVAILKAIFEFNEPVQYIKINFAKFLNDPNKKVVLYAALLLAKSGDKAALKPLLNIIFSRNFEFISIIRDNFSQLHYQVKNSVGNLIQREISLRCNELKSMNLKQKKKIRIVAIQEMSELLSFMESEKEMYNIRAVLAEQYGV